MSDLLPIEKARLAAQKKANEDPKVAASTVEGVVLDFLDRMSKGQDVSLTDMAADPAFRGIHFRRIEQAVESLENKDVVGFDGVRVTKMAARIRSTWKEARGRLDIEDIYELDVNGDLDDDDAEKLLGVLSRSTRDPEKGLRVADKMLRTHGVEVLEEDPEDYGAEPFASYLNTGDLYNVTLAWVYPKGQWEITTAADLRQAMSRGRYAALGDGKVTPRDAAQWANEVAQVAAKHLPNGTTRHPSLSSRLGGVIAYGDPDNPAYISLTSGVGGRDHDFAWASVDYYMPGSYAKGHGFKMHPRTVARVNSTDGDVREIGRQVAKAVQSSSFAKRATDKVAGSGAANAKYLDSLPSGAKAKILKAVAAHYGVSTSEIEEELKDRDAEALYEYLAFNNSMAMQVYRDFKRMRLATEKTAASGLYGFTKKTQRDCEATIRKVKRQAKKIAKRIYGKDNRVSRFLQVHANRTDSSTAKLLIAAMQELGPKFASETPVDKTAGYGLYGFNRKTAGLGLSACTDLRDFVGTVAYDLHSRRQARYDRITNFFTKHSKKSKCQYSKLLLASYPDQEQFKMAQEEQAALQAQEKKASTPNSVDEWLAWDDRVG